MPKAKLKVPMTTKDVPYSWEISKSDKNGDRQLFQGATHCWVNRPIYGAKDAKGQKYHLDVLYF